MSTLRGSKDMDDELRRGTPYEWCELIRDSPDVSSAEGFFRDFSKIKWDDEVMKKMRKYYVKQIMKKERK